MGGMVLSYAWAAALQQAVVCIGRLLVQGMLTPLGTNTVTGYNMSLRIEQFLFCFSQGVSAAMVVCLSQNLGHGDRVRVRRFYRVSVCVEAALIAVLGTVCFLFPSQIVGLFSDNGEVIAAGARYTGTMAYLYLFAYMGEVIQGFFRGLGRLRLTMVASLLQVVLRVVLSYFLIPVWGMYGICVAVASGWGAAGAHRGQLQRQNGAGFDYGKKRRLKIRDRLGEPSYFINRSISSGSGAVKCRARVCERVGEPQRIRVQRGAGDQRPILCAVEPVARKRMTEGRHVDAELVRASGSGARDAGASARRDRRAPHTPCGRGDRRARRSA